ncbi:hypothetical protein OIU74_002585 [Salix koriyanagi]|uniref:Uncharacterized protein n=1 Tax=Salix koriyanagi TaxID=2511006 RepID=A0A9Q0X4J1_9ROSI|nr:hypothetical protein OIU74_002585 [Salix koriyanagi]
MACSVISTSPGAISCETPPAAFTCNEMELRDGLRFPFVSSLHSPSKSKLQSQQRWHSANGIHDAGQSVGSIILDNYWTPHKWGLV